jgi:MFS superfamily sulfate permease-like transporter
VPISTQSGEHLESRVSESSLIETHSQLAEQLLPWTFGLAAVAAVLFWWNFKERTATGLRTPKWVAFALAATAVLASTGTTIQAIRIGHSGATAAWSEDMNTPVAAGNKD